VIAKATLPDLFAGMNKTEKLFAFSLEAQQRQGIVHSWMYERVTLKLGDDCRYTPDFFVILPDGQITIYETKGAFIREDARVKLRAAAEMFPFRFILAQYKKKVWTAWEIKRA
jgi:hypothetical protein